MDRNEFEHLFDGITLPPDVLRRLERIHEQAEGDVEARWVHRLVTHYSYQPKQISLGVAAGAGRAASRSSVYADIVVYRDVQRTEPFIVIEVKKPGTSAFEGVKQAESYSRNLGADYHVWSDGTETRFFKTAKYVDQSTAVGNIPTWAYGKAEDQFLSKEHILPPFRDEEDLRQVVRKCHDKIFFNLGHDPAKSFDELMKLLFTKMFDERMTPRVYKFAALPGKTKREVGDHIRGLFSEAVQSPRYSDVFTTRFLKTGENISLDLDDETIFYVVQQFQNYSLVNTTSTLEGVDIKGTVFERMVGSTFRGELGAYFTPRELVEFCVRALDPGVDDRVLDPSCGSGGFLIMVLKHIREKLFADNPNLSEAELSVALKDFAEKNIFGVDINERMVRVTKMNMIMHGDGHSGIYNTHGLSIGKSDRLPIREASISKIFSNPPFAGREIDPVHLARFETPKKEDGTLISLHKTIPFVEMIVKLLKPGGTAALVLPNGIFNSPSSTFRKLREIIFDQTTILGVIGLPHWVFFHTGCDVQGSLLFIKKEPPPEDYRIFMDWADNVGYDAKGSKTRENDLPAILERFRERPQSHMFRFSDIRKADRFDPLYWRPGVHSAAFARIQGAATLADIAEPGGITISKSAKNKAKYRYLEVSGADTLTGKIIETREYEASQLPSRAKYIVREGMVLFPNHRNSIAAKRAPVLITEEHDGIVVTSRFIPLFCKVPPQYVYNILNLDITKEKLLTMVTGGSSTEIKWEIIKNLPIPLPPDGDYDTFLADVAEIEDKIDANSRALDFLKKDLRKKFQTLFS
ncbi:N-6 DNA methylase [Sinorhizobium meliloti]|nr:N-6 DNA methylase [Sinorhizobium meliloti]